MAASTRLTTETVASIRALISDGAYRSGDRLPPERDLCEALGVSRPTVREAITRLATEGALEPRRGSGTYVARVDLRDLFDVRLALEPVAAAGAAVNRSPEDLAILDALLTEMRAALDDPARFAALDLRAHMAIAAAAGNAILLDQLERLTRLVTLSRSRTAVSARIRRRTFRDLTRLVAAIRIGDAAAAADAMRAHLSEVRRSLDQDAA